MFPDMSKMMRIESSTSVNTNATTDDELEEGSSIKLIEVIFLPFHPIFRFIVVATAIIKVYLGPLTCTFNFMYCSDARTIPYVKYILYYYLYIGDGVYIFDTLLRIVHRQVEDEARKREYLPKSALLILMDLFSIVPLFRMFVEGTCPPIKIWPNVLCFNEILPIYRVVDYFSLMVTHSLLNLCIGYSITALLVINSITCFFLMLTFGGFCKECSTKPYDWRSPFLVRYDDFKNNSNLQYLHGFQYVFGYVSHLLPDYLQPKTMTNQNFTSLLMIIGYLIWTFLLVPRFFSEFLLKLRHKLSFNNRVKKIISETERRNPEAHRLVEKYYSVLWNNWNGITSIPDIVNSIPRHLILSIKQDLVWAVFHHSPTFRRTTLPYKRWLCEHINLEIKLAGERFFSGLHCYTNLYYLKSGVIQFFSSDDASSAMLSLTSGTIFGDISCIVPPLNRKVMVRCMTYCEVFVVTRATVLVSLHKFPADRRNILQLVYQRMKHAKDLYSCKSLTRGKDIVQDEGIEWLKRRWWEIYNTISRHKKTKKSKCELPPEEENHCAKFIGQLVLCPENRLQKKSMFVSDEFPWLIGDRSKFFRIWTFVVWITVCIVVLLFPPNIVRTITMEPTWFAYVRNCVDLIFAVDIGILLLTTVEEQENTLNSFTAVVIYRLKTLTFIFDLLATFWIDLIINLMGRSDLVHFFRFNRLFKTHILFIDRHYVKWRRTNRPTRKVLRDISLWHILFLYVLGYLLYIITILVPDLTPEYFFFHHCLAKNVTDCIFKDYGVISLTAGYFFRMFYFMGADSSSKSAADTVFELFFFSLTYTLSIYTRSYILAAFYFKYKRKVQYQHFVRNLTIYYKQQKIHPDLMTRLQRYLLCHWKYFSGADITQVNPMAGETFVIYWKCHGETAEKILRESEMLKDCDPGLIRELAQKAKLLLLPKKAALLLFGVQMYRLNWLLKGTLKCEYQNDNNETVINYVLPGEVLCVLSVLYGGASVRTYTAASDCEILYITRGDFFDTVKRYPVDASYFECALREMRPDYLSMVEEYAVRHSEYQKAVQKKIFSAEHSSITSGISLKKRPKKGLLRDNLFTRMYRQYRTNPESLFIRTWMTIRALFALEQIVYAVLNSTHLIPDVPGMIPLHMTINISDAVIRMFMPHYDKDGKVISSWRKCIFYYMTHTFFVDLFNFFPSYEHMYIFFGHDKEAKLFTHIGVCCLPMYLVTGWFDYITNSHKTSVAYGIVSKWQTCILVVMFCATGFFWGLCVKPLDGVYMKNDNCWLPSFFLYRNNVIPESSITMIFLQGFLLAQNYCMKVASSMWKLHHSEIQRHVVIYMVLGYIFWWASCKCQAVLILNSKGDSEFYESIKQLEMFLKSERVDKGLINRVILYYQNLWVRTSGLDLRNLMNERLGIVFRQDLNYYFYQRAFAACAAIVGGDNNFERQLASHVTEMHYLPDQEIARELNLTPTIFIVNRGKVAISKEGKRLATLTKGAIFGQMVGKTLRPMKCSAVATEHTDVLQLTVKEFQGLLTSQLKREINKDPRFKEDYLNVLKQVPEDPYDSIKYLLRGKKTIKLPGMKSPVQYDTNKWYFRWLLLSWLVVPVATVIFTTFLSVTHETSVKPPYELVNKRATKNLLFTLAFLDVLFLLHIISEFYTMYLVIRDDRVVYKYKKLAKIRDIWLYVNILSLIVPWVSLAGLPWTFHLARLTRIHMLYYVHKYFCRNMKIKYLEIILMCISIILLLHCLACLWICVVCRFDKMMVIRLPNRTMETYDPQLFNDQGIRRGCYRMTPPIDIKKFTNLRMFVNTNSWVHDYCLALTFVISIFTKTNVDLISPRTIVGSVTKIIITFLTILMDLHLSSIAISTAYNKLRDTYRYDHRVRQLLMYLKRHGLSNILLSAIQDYTSHLWQRQKGCWLPEITSRAPQCMREDIMSGLYIHHLITPPLFEHLPPFFMRQLATRLERIVIYPGKCIVQEGDIYPCMFFIHEGEVERWYTDASGESRLSAVLTINGYFGLIPGLFPNTPYQFAYYSRTVCDLVYLNFDNWQDLLNGYSDIKYKLYRAAIQFKKETAT